MAEPADRAGRSEVGGRRAEEAVDVSSPFARLVEEPTWRERAAALVAGTSALRLAAGAVVGVIVAALVAAAVLADPAPLPELTMPVAGGAGDPGATTTTTTTAPPAPAEVVVHAAGAVTSPGVYRLAAGSRVADLLDAAGGPAPGADLDRLNLAALLLDGERVFVALPDQAVPPAEGGGGGSAAGDGHDPGGGERAGRPVDLNLATLAELETLPGVGPATAQAILDERARRGRFGSVEDLLEVRGIGEAKLAALRDLARV